MSQFAGSEFFSLPAIHLMSFFWADRYLLSKMINLWVDLMLASGYKKASQKGMPKSIPFLFAVLPSYQAFNTFSSIDEKDKLFTR